MISPVEHVSSRKHQLNSTMRLCYVFVSISGEVVDCYTHVPLFCPSLGEKAPYECKNFCF